MDPVTSGLAVAQFISGLIARHNAERVAQKSLELQQENLANSLAAARESQRQGLTEAGGLRTDQFGNTTYYDPQQGRWVTAYTPTQQRIIAGGQAQQERALARAAQASEDYAQQRAGYLYKQPPSEEATRADIVRLITQARGEGDRALANLVQRQELRQSGNLPVIINASTALSPAPGQRLADVMLKAREAALSETGQRQKQHAEQYLPAMQQFEKTAGYVQPINPTGSGIIGIQQQQGQDYLKALENYGKLVESAYSAGGKGELAASGQGVTAENVGQSSQAGGLAALAKALAPAKTTTAAPTPAAPAPITMQTDTGEGAPLGLTGDYAGAFAPPPEKTSKPWWQL